MTTKPGFLLLNRDAATQAEIENGTANKFVSAAPLKAAIPTKRFTSSQITSVLGGSSAVAHNLGVTPKTIELYYVCVTADAGTGWQPGDVIPLATIYSYAGTSANIGGANVGGDGSNLTLSQGATAPYLAVKGGGGVANITSIANFKWVIVAEA